MSFAVSTIAFHPFILISLDTINQQCAVEQHQTKAQANSDQYSLFMRMPCSLPALDQELAQQIIVSVTEAFVFIFSVVASYLHFTKANSRRISLEVTFHFLHVNFCAVYVGYHAILTSIPGICLCDDINALFVLELGLFAVGDIYSLSHCLQFPALKIYTFHLNVDAFRPR